MRTNIYPHRENEDRGVVSVDRTEGTETCIVSIDTDFYEDLSQYLEVLSNSTRLRILKLIEKDAQRPPPDCCRDQYQLRQHQEAPR